MFKFKLYYFLLPDHCPFVSLEVHYDKQNCSFLILLPTNHSYTCEIDNYGRLELHFTKHNIVFFLWFTCQFQVSYQTKFYSLPSFKQTHACVSFVFFLLKILWQPFSGGNSNSKTLRKPKYHKQMETSRKLHSTSNYW